MAKAKKKTAKKAAKKAAGKKAKKKTITKRKTAVSPRPKARTKVKAKAKAAPKRAVKTPAKRRKAPSGVQLGVSFELDERLRALATQMNKTLEQILLQALTEFADTWEDHMHTVKSLAASDDRMQLAVAPEDSSDH
jgi:predicted transcriptional regulator